MYLYTFKRICDKVGVYFFFQIIVYCSNKSKGHTSPTFIYFTLTGAGLWGIAEVPHTNISVSLLRFLNVRNWLLVQRSHSKSRGMFNSYKETLLMWLVVMKDFSFLLGSGMKQQGWPKVDNWMLSFLFV